MDSVASSCKWQICKKNIENARKIKLFDFVKFHLTLGSRKLLISVEIADIISEMIPGVYFPNPSQSQRKIFKK